MCGILVIQCKHTQTQLDEIKKAYDLLSNRGPDSGILEINSKYIVGFRRLAINDKSTNGNQPFKSGSVILVCNGEIFNHKELERKYDITCKSQSDCECIIYLYQKFGFRKTIELLDGDFAIVILDGSKIFFARDRIGVRPLFMSQTNNMNLALASYSRALVNFSFTSPEQVLPGEIYEFCSETQELKIETYYSSFSADITEYLNSKYSEEIYQNQLYELLTKSVEKRLMSERPIACLLSGGLDSSLITSITQSKLQEIYGPEYRLQTYSIGMEGSIDLEYARQVSDYLHTNHTEVIFTPEEGFAVIPEVIRDLECYDITTIRASVGMWLLAKYISSQKREIVLLSGEGADELFCGYLYFHYAPTNYELSLESSRLISELYLYDVLRADRCISSHGLELRVPFLDREILDLMGIIPGSYKAPYENLEKYHLRKAFQKYELIPEKVLLRRKDGFSDGCSNPKKSWYMYIEEFVNEIIPDSEFKQDIFPSKEAQYYKQIYDKIFPTYQPVYNYWLPKWINHGGNPSGRIIDIYNKTI